MSWPTHDDDDYWSVPAAVPGCCLWCSEPCADRICQRCTQAWQEEQAAMDRQSIEAQAQDYAQYWADLPHLHDEG